MNLCKEIDDSIVSGLIPSIQSDLWFILPWNKFNIVKKIRRLRELWDLKCQINVNASKDEIHDILDLV